MEEGRIDTPILAAPPALLATTGFPHAIASAITSPKGSGSTLAWTTISSVLIAPGTSSTLPVNAIEFAKPERRRFMPQFRQ